MSNFIRKHIAVFFGNFKRTKSFLSNIFINFPELFDLLSPKNFMLFLYQNVPENRKVLGRPYRKRLLN